MPAGKRSFHRQAVFLMAPLFIGGLVYGSYLFDIQGPWVDKTFSFLVTRHLDIPVKVNQVRIHRWSELQFDSLIIQKPPGRILMRSGPGIMTIDPSALFSKKLRESRLTLNEVEINEDFFKKSVLIRWASEKAVQAPVLAKKALIYLRESDTHLLVHLMHFQSEEMFIKGGIYLSEKKVVKAHAIVFLPEVFFENMPRQMRARMVKRPDGWHGIRIAYSQNKLTVYGRLGPFFSANWH